LIILVIHYGNTEVESHHEPIWNRHGIDISPRKVLRLTDRNNDELAIEREMLPMIVMWMSPGNETGTGLVVRTKFDIYVFLILIQM
jgi:beta-lactamase class D